MMSQEEMQELDEEKHLKKLNQLIEIQGIDGNWDHNDYMTGLYNGLILAKSVFTGEEPKFRKYLKEDILN